MALIKCSECGHDMSNQAKMCPNCGYQNNTFNCPECNKPISVNSSSCPYCGYIFSDVQENLVTINSKGKNYALAIFSFIFSFISSVISLTLAVIVCSSNKNEKNDATTLAIISSVICLIRIVITIIYFLYTYFHIEFL